MTWGSTLTRMPACAVCVCLVVDRAVIPQHETQIISGSATDIGGLVAQAEQTMASMRKENPNLNYAIGVYPPGLNKPADGYVDYMPKPL